MPNTKDVFDFSFPFKKFSEWFDEAKACKEIAEPIATTLATATKQGIPSARILFVKIFGEDGFKFFTNYNSTKSKELSENPYAVLNYYWAPLGTQVRITGRVEKLSAKENDDYFNSRPLESRVASSLSNQSHPLDSFEAFLEKIESVTKEYEQQGKEYPRPDNWGGWKLIPDSFEFWKAGEYRIHQREIFKLNADGKWEHTKLYP